MDVVVIGAGLSGLTAAARLAQAGVNVVVLEADTDIGGRIRAIRAPISGQAIGDLGPTWVWPKYQPVAARWLKTLGIRTFEQFNTGNAVITGYGPQTTYQPLPGQDGMVRIVGGPTALIEALAQRLGPGSIRANALVTKLCPTGSQQVSIGLDTGEEIVADKVIMALPLRVAATTLDLPWASPNLLNAMQDTPTWMSTHAKAVALYERPFWRDVGLSGRVASAGGPLVEVHDHTAADMQPAALFGFVGWRADKRQAAPEQLRQGILTQLAQCFGPQAGSPRDLVIQDWATNPRIVSPLDLSQPISHPVVRPSILRQTHLDGRAYFAVSEVSERSPGLIEGALAIGEAVALAVLKDHPTGHG